MQNNANITAEEWARFATVYSVPRNVRQYMERLFTPLEVRFALNVPERFGVPEAAATLATLGEDSRKAEQFLHEQYKIGFLNLTDETETEWTLAGYATYLDVWCVWENDEYRSRFLPEELRDLDAKYFHQSFDPKAKKALEEGVAPSNDEVYTLDETLAWIDARNEPAYLSYCDCRSLAGDCGMSRETCISYQHGINTYAHRGWSRRLTVEETKEAVRRFDEAGLMHTLNGSTICNCCGDCCYLSRGRDQIASGPNWPRAHHVVAYDATHCVGCGCCVKRCWRGVFSQVGRKVLLDTSKCVGCGLCANTCPTKALAMRAATFPGLRVQASRAGAAATH